MNAPHELTFFTDRDLGHRFPEQLRVAGLRVERHDDHFAPTAPDDEWIAEVGSRRWIAISRDTRIRYSPLALQVLMQSGARLFVIVGKLTTDRAAELFIRHHAQVQRIAMRESGAFIAKVRQDGVHLWIRFSEWQRM